jgi:predicted dienelactone hydrolase
LWLAALGGLLLSEARAYDPLSVAPASTATRDLTVTDAARHRDIPVKAYLPAGFSPAPVVLFSHGLGGSREGSAFLGEHWAGRGYLAVFLQHPGSDTGVWKSKGAGAGLKAMKEAASAENFMLRVKDVPAVLDQLEVWNRQEGHPLKGRLDLSKVGMSGHSFGAVTTQAVSGQKAALGGAGFTDSRIRAAIAFSPSLPATGTPENAFGSVKIPWMLMTGTEDASPISGATPESRRRVYPALPPGDKYELVLFGAPHSVFTERGSRNPNHHRAILALSTAFWDAELRGDGAAKAWLEGEGPCSVLEAQDRWQHK